MAGDGDAGVEDIEDARSRLLVRLTRAPSPTFERWAHELAAADRLAGLIATDIAPPLAFALSLPTALLTGAESGPREGVAGGVLHAADDIAGDVASFRRRRGAAAILLIDVATSRHAAMAAGEEGADAILFSGPFEAVRDCIAWWSELFVLPAAAATAPARVLDLVRAGADFIVIDDVALADLGEPPKLVIDFAQAEVDRSDPLAMARSGRDER